MPMQTHCGSKATDSARRPVIGRNGLPSYRREPPLPVGGVAGGSLLPQGSDGPGWYGRWMHGKECVPKPQGPGNIIPLVPVERLHGTEPNATADTGPTACRKATTSLVRQGCYYVLWYCNLPSGYCLGQDLRRRPFPGPVVRVPLTRIDDRDAGRKCYTT